MKKLIIIPAILICFTMMVFYGLPAFAQTHIAASIPGQPFMDIAARNIIINSGLPRETSPGDITNALTRGRDAVDAYRYAHEQLSKDGWYRGIGDDHTPLLVAMIDELEKQGFKSDKVALEEKASDVLEKFWYDSDTENAKELGFASVEEMNTAIVDMAKSGKDKESKQLQDSLDVKWK